MLNDHQAIRDYIVKYLKYNLFGLLVFVVSSFVYWVFGSGGWTAFIMAGGIGGLVEFNLQLYFVYGSGKIFERVNPKWRKYDDLIHGRRRDDSER